jgi:hypothetical protein
MDGGLLAYSDDGVDLTLIRWMLSLTPAERLEALQQYVVQVRGRNFEPSLSWNAGHLDEVLDLETLIAVKEEVGGEKDRAVLPVLRRTLEESRLR